MERCPISWGTMESEEDEALFCVVNPFKSSPLWCLPPLTATSVCSPGHGLGAWHQPGGPTAPPFQSLSGSPLGIAIVTSWCCKPRSAQGLGRRCPSGSQAAATGSLPPPRSGQQQGVSLSLRSPCLSPRPTPINRSSSALPEFTFPKDSCAVLASLQISKSTRSGG